MSTGKKTAISLSVRGYRARKLCPTIEVVESRHLLAAGVGVIAGTAFLDLNSNNGIDVNETYLPGATVQLYLAGSATPLATQTTDAHGAYSFTGLTPGDYTVVEIPPAGDTVTGTQILYQLGPASSDAGNKVQVTVPSNPLYLNYYGVLPGVFQVSNNRVNGTNLTDSEGQLQVSLGSAAGATDVNPGFLSYCLDDLHRLTFGGGEQFQVVPKPITSASNGTSTIPADRAGRIAFLYNHFGNASLSNIESPAIQLAIWELLYDTGATPDFSAGNFQVLSPDLPFTDQSTLDQVLTQATAYFNLSAGKSETAILLDASGDAVPGVADGSQSMIAEGSFNFANRPAPPIPRSSLAGSVYCDHNLDGLHDAGDQPVAGALIALTGTDQNGVVVKRTFVTGANGAYQFPNLAPGTYTLTLLKAPRGYLPAHDNQGTPGTGITQTNRFLNIALPAGVAGVSNDFGLKGQAVNVTNLQLLGIHQQQSQIVLQFNGPLNEAAARQTANYSLIGLGKDEAFGTADDVRYAITSAAYNASNATVTLTPDAHLNIHYHYLLQFNLPGVNDCAPNVLYTQVFGRTAVPYFDVHGVTQPNPPLTPAQARHNAQVVAATLAKLGRAVAVSPAHAVAAAPVVNTLAVGKVSGFH